MSLAELLAAHDDAALEALSSKGLVRRARRDFEAGLARVTEHNATTATVSADGQTVAVDSRGLAQCRCTCPAGGVCRHVVLAIMALRGAEAATAAPGPRPGEPQFESMQRAVDDLLAIAEADLRKFAGAAWAAARALADASHNAAIHEEGRNCRVDLVAAAVTVTFIAGQPLKAAAYKGPKARARAVTTAAAILVRARHGVAVEAGEPAAAPEQSLSAEFLGATRDAVVRAVRSVLAGPSPLIIDTLFDLAISARADSAPRLTAQLRALASDAGLALNRDVNFEPDRFVAAAADIVALVEGLAAKPLDAALTGSLRRNYEPHETLELWMLCASCWRSDTGARGVTFHAFAAQEREWYSATIARAAGQDPTFDARAAYRQPLWGAGQPETLMGNRLMLAEPLVASDRSIAVTQQRPAAKAGRLRSAVELVDAGAAHTSWHALRADLARRFGAGLRRRALPLPAILCPAQFRGFAFDELAQVYELEVIDADGAALVLTLPAGASGVAQRLRREGNQLKFVCVEATAVNGRSLLRPIAIGIEASSAVEIVNLDLDPWPQQSMAQAALSRLRELVSSPPGPRPMTDPLRRLASRSLQVATSAASAAPIADANGLAGECEAAGLLTLARALEHLTASPDVASALRTAYLASEVEAAAIWA
jgi:SWIM zinc finger